MIIMTAENIVKIILNISSKIESEKDFLTELDNEIGDGDHGINLARGFGAVSGKMEAMKGKTPSDVIKTTGMTLVSTVGGASGPLFGTGFMRLATAWNGKDDISIEDFLNGLKAAIDGISARGRSTKGEKTMLDAMIPSLEAMTAANSEGREAKEVISEGIKAAWEGVEFTKTIAATKGRASYVGERSIGHQDPGATSYTMMLEQIEKVL